MSENANKSTEKAESSMVEDIMAGTPEVQSTPEQSVEAGVEAAERATPVAIPAAEATPSIKVESARKEVEQLAPKDPELMQVERKLEDRELWGLYVSLTKTQRERFKEGGEALAVRFRGMFGRTDVDPVDVLQSIEGWLESVPGIIRPYVRQAAKTKTDDVLALIREHSAAL